MEEGNGPWKRLKGVRKNNGKGKREMKGKAKWKMIKT
jgi:hypothetical protein